MSWNFGLGRHFDRRLTSASAEAELLRFVVIGAGQELLKLAVLELEADVCDLADLPPWRLIFFKEGFLLMPTLLVLEEGDPEELLVVPTRLPVRFKGPWLMPTLALCWRPLLDILGVGEAHPVTDVSKNLQKFQKNQHSFN